MEKKYVIIWSTVGYILSIISCIGYAIFLFNHYPFSLTGTIILLLYVVAITALFFVGIKNLIYDYKRIIFGVLFIIFFFVVGGVLYIVWNPENEDQRKIDSQKENDKHNQ